MGHVAILDRFRQIEPKVLIAQDGYVHAGKRSTGATVLDDDHRGAAHAGQTVMVPVVGELPDGPRRTGRT